MGHVSAERFLLRFGTVADKIDVLLLCQTDNVIKVIQPWVVSITLTITEACVAMSIFSGYSFECSDANYKLFCFHKKTLMV